MKTKIIIVGMLLALATISTAATVERQGDGRMLKRGDDVPQGFSPNGLYSANDSTNATFHNLTSFLAYSFYCPADCYVRFLPTAAKGSYPQMTFPGDTWHTFVKNAATPFVNISSAAGAAHQWLQQ